MGVGVGGKETDSKIVAARGRVRTENVYEHICNLCKDNGSDVNSEWAKDLTL